MKKARTPTASRMRRSRRVALARLLRKVRGTFLGVIPGFRRSRAANDPRA
jgi:hypothetical protein